MPILYILGIVKYIPVSFSSHNFLTCRNLEVLTIYRGTLGDAFFDLLDEFPVLNRLNIAEADLDRGGNQEIHIRHGSLRYLEVIRCRALRIIVRYI